MEDFQRAGAQKIVFHYEATNSPPEVISLIKNCGLKVGLAINPETPVSAILPLASVVDSVLFLSVNPGFYGSTFLPETLSKVKTLRELKPSLDIEVDGGIKPDTIRQAHDAGANKFVSGSYIIKASNPQKAMDDLRAKIE